MGVDSGRLPLGGTPWWVWEHFALRSAGFPMRDLTEALAGPVGEDPAAHHAVDGGRTGQLRRALDLATTERVTMALLWQNPDIVEHVVEPLTRRLRALDAGDATDTKRDRQRLRRRERTLASYLQRYHTRNETIGFFGPITWGRFADRPTAVRVTPGERLTDEQIVCFEDWAIERLARRFLAHRAIRSNLAPVVRPDFERVGRMVLRAGAAPHRLSEAQAAVMDLVDGERRVAEIAASLGDRFDVAAVLDTLVAEGHIEWGFALPVGPHCVDDLTDRLRELPDDPVVRDALAAVRELVATRDRVAGARTAAELATALGEVDRCFGAHTGEAPRRTADAAERGRRLLVGQSHRAVDVVLGPAVLAELADPLGLVLASCRWFCWRIGELATGTLDALHRALSDAYGRAGVPLNVLFAGAVRELESNQARITQLTHELARRWVAVLGLDEKSERVQLRATELTGAVAEAFASPSPLWYAGRHHSPDLMLAADGVEAVERGSYQFVLGEIHTGTVTCDSATINGFAPAPEAILRPAEAALDDGPERFVPLYRRGTPDLTARSYPTPETFSPRYRYLGLGPAAGERPVPPGRRIDLAALRAVPGSGGLSTRLPDGVSCPTLSIFGEFLAMLTKQAYSPMPDWAHTPRVAVDRLVIARETWRIPAGELAASVGADGAGALAPIADRYGLPRHCFWRASPGVKPIYLDLHSPMLVRLFAEAVRRADPAARVCLTEMLPGPDQLWLVDAEGRRYTSELRLTVAERGADA